MSSEKRIQLDKNKYDVRLSQIITTFGPGGIMDFIDQPLMTASQKYWGSPIKISEERLAKKLNVSNFIAPQDADSKYNVPFVRFPSWYYCPECNKLKQIKDWEKEYLKAHRSDDKIKYMKKPVCTNHKNEVQLVAPSILVACKRGHIDDFPWSKWAHKNVAGECSNPELELISSSGSLGLDNIKVRCTNCNAENSLKLASSKNGLKNFTCKGEFQWKNEREKCEEKVQMVLRNASNIYFPKIESSLSIPPYSDDINTMINDSSEFESLKSAMNKKEKKGKLKEFIKDDLEDYIEEISKEINMKDKVELVDKIVCRELFDKENASEKTKNDYRYEEYNALTGISIPDEYTSRDFKIEKKDLKDYGIEELSKVILVKRLREVRALVGFSRINMYDNFIMGTKSNNDEVKIIDIKDKESKAYPAYEVRGEGIFIELNLKLIDSWVKENNEISKRAQKLNDRYSKVNKGSYREITPKFILLHTLAHLLIKELSFECGYSSTSLRERIYCDVPSDNYNMSGILIYTADSDSEGSLGGLVKQGEPNILPRILKKAIKKAVWCSYDPICINSTGQGFKNLNLSACYSCALLPETSCEEFNTLLDRVAIVGTLDNRNMGFFSKYI
ncbi:MULTISPECIES: DUF1998 domain-containing protein [Clostridium]|uniref:DUF1998 domain-containing protein n=1 Tax=Clostridium TaxID=1485 RepID=UPI000825519B|nr:MULTISPECIES: DUF1998 domain-containing protein [Clostridium]PJI06833.1 DUF1998 domain-containing protein [Clostridium sp. CT7]